MARENGLRTDDSGLTRCWWAGSDPLYVGYHDEEWGRPVADDRLLFGKICLEGFQAGLSWLTILRKRENFRAAFRGFDFEAVARFGERDAQRLLSNEGIVRHQGKIRSTINNAVQALKLVDEFGSLASYFWQFEPSRKSRPKRMTHGVLMKLTTTPESTAMSKDLKARGWSFVGPTTCYAFMQAMGMVNDHIEGCHARVACTEARRAFSL